MDNNFNWIKMGNKIMKIACMVCFIFMLQTNMSNKSLKKTENFNLNMTLGLTAMAEKIEEEPPKFIEVKEEKKKTENKSTKSKKSVSKSSTKTNTNKKSGTQNTVEAKVPADTKEASTNKANAASLKRLTGSLTGYAADCPQCGGTLACKSSYKVLKNGVVTYPDAKYGNVRIVASSKNLACGSIIKFNLKTISSEPIIAIVLDRGVRGNNIDLLMPTESAARKQVGRRNITYDIIRNGW